MLVRSEGGLLPADVLARIVGGDRELGGLDADAFHLVGGERVREAIARSWARLSTAWDLFSTERERVEAGDTQGRLTRERWTLPLFAELGFGRLVQQPAVEVEDRSFAVFCEWQATPIHLLGAGVPLDRRTAGVRGAAEQSPHSLVQELLNRSGSRLWGVVCNGLSLRLLRDNATLTRQAYVEFDLEGIFAAEAYEDFALLWLCSHQSRFEAERPEECRLERWTEAAQRDGARALESLRSGVEDAISALGRGFLAQPGNAALQQALKDGALDGTGFYRQLLRLVYRLLFVFVAEDRDVLLLPENGTAERRLARSRYADFYSTRRLRGLAGRRRGGRAFDLYELLKLLSEWLHDGGRPELALPVLGSALWDPATTPHLADARLTNQALLEAIFALSRVEGGRRPVDFRHLGAEELGSVYESLLELHPEIDRTTASFALTTAAGHERKQTGSYYTPSSLIGSLLETALDPVIEQAARSGDAEQALLDLTVCDPACGSGHFLIAAANRIAKRLAGVREQDPEPAPEAVRRALRDVVARCVHGVDANPMAVELCRVSLWLEALEPGRPLSFLDDRILLGNSLLGTTPALIEAGVPDAAFKPLLGDAKEVVKAWKAHNTRERKGQDSLRLATDQVEQDATELAAAAVRQRAIADDSLAGVRAREQGYRDLVASGAYERLRLAADTWTAAFVTPKLLGAARITTGVVRRAVADGVAGLSADERASVRAEAERYSPLHWHVAFPASFRAGGQDAGEHGWVGGFDCVLGNPPWERVKLQEKEFFAGTAPKIAAAKNKAAREKLIAALVGDDPALHLAFVAAKRRAEGESHLLRSTDRYPLCGRGDVNTYAVFAEAMRSVLAPTGRLGVIVPTGIATDDTTKLFFADMVARESLSSLFSFWEARRFFQGKDDRSPFCLLTVRGTGGREAGEYAFNLHAVAELNDPERRFELTAEDIRLLNPNTRTCPIFRTRRDAEITKGIYSRVPVLVREGDPDGNPWGIRFLRMFDMSTDSGLFHTRDELEVDGWQLDGNVFVRAGKRMLPLYEAKMIHHFDQQWATYEPDGRIRDVTAEERVDPEFSVMPRYWVSEQQVDARVDDQQWPMVAWQRNARATEFRTFIVTPLAKCAVGDSIFLGAVPEGGGTLARYTATFIFDYVVRQKVNGTNLSFYLVEQFPVPRPDLLQRINLADACDFEAGVAQLLGLSRVALGEILDTFPIVRRKDEARFGEYRTKRLILEAYDRLAADSTTAGLLDPAESDGSAPVSTLSSSRR